jgi:hypothetical protein
MASRRFGGAGELAAQLGIHLAATEALRLELSKRIVILGLAILVVFSDRKPVEEGVVTAGGSAVLGWAGPGAADANRVELARLGFERGLDPDLVPTNRRSRSRSGCAGAAAAGGRPGGSRGSAW